MAGQYLLFPLSRANLENEADIADYRAMLDEEFEVSASHLDDYFMKLTGTGVGVYLPGRTRE